MYSEETRYVPSKCCGNVPTCGPSPRDMSPCDMSSRDLPPRDLPLRNSPLRDLPPRETTGRGCGCGCARNGGDAVLLPENLSCVKLGDLPIAMAYVPMQEWREIFEADIALREGTQFRELALPFTKGRPGGENRGGCRG